MEKQGNVPVTTMDLRQEALDHLWVHGASWDGLASPDGIKIIVRGEGVRIYDSEGKSYIDVTAALELCNVGYGRKEIADAAYAQLLDIPIVNTFKLQTPPQIKLAARLAHMTPGSLNSVFFVCSGSEAVETARKIAIQYQYQSGYHNRYKTISRRGSYHGSTLGCMTIAGARGPGSSFGPVAPGGLQVPAPNCYRCAYNLEYPSCDLTCCRAIESLIQFEGPETVAAVVIDPVSITQPCTVVPPKEYIPMVREICDRYGVLMYCDEAINGFGRTGKMFAVEHWNVVPDILTVSKGIASGYAPLSAAIATEKVAAAFRGSAGSSFRHIHTWGGHPVSCAAALANLDILERERLVENSATMGAYFLQGLNSLAETHPMVGNVQGLGLMLGVDLVKDRKTKEPISMDAREKLSKKAWDKGLFWGYNFFTPPLNITKPDIDEIVTNLDKAFAEIEKEYSIG